MGKEYTLIASVTNGSAQYVLAYDFYQDEHYILIRRVNSDATHACFAGFRKDLALEVFDTFVEYWKGADKWQK